MHIARHLAAWSVALCVASGCTAAAVPSTPPEQSPSPTGGTEGTPVDIAFPGILVPADGGLPTWNPAGAESDAIGAPSEVDLVACPDPPEIVTAGQLLDGIQCDQTLYVDDAVDAGVVDSVIRNGIRARELRGGPTRAVVRRSTVTGPTAISGEAVWVDHSHIMSTNDGVTPTGGLHGPPSVIEFNKMERDGSQFGDNHHDGIQLWQGGNVTIRRNWISGFHTAAILIKSDLEQVPGDGPIRNVLIEENYLANPTGYFSVYVRDGGKGRPQFVTIRNNVFGPGTPVSSGDTPQDEATFVRTERQREEAVAAGVADAAEWIVFHGNIDAVTGEEIVPPGGWRDPS